MANFKTPPERHQFSKRLRTLRVHKGFRTARSFAARLDIDENRYTRYERAEVEPDLPLIVRMCTVLDVSPNDLLGFGPAAVGMTPGLSDNAQPLIDAHASDPPPSCEAVLHTSPSEFSRRAWQLAQAIVEIELAASHDPTKSNHTGSSPEGATLHKPLARLSAVTEHYSRLMSDPFQAIATLLKSPPLQQASDADQDRVAGLTERLIEAAGSSPRTT